MLNKTLSYEKGMYKMLMKLTLGVNFINILRNAALAPSDPESSKRQLSRQSFLHFRDLGAQKRCVEC